MLLPAAVKAQLYYADNGDSTATITGCGPNFNGAMTVPDTNNGLKVSSIGDSAFEGRIPIGDRCKPMRSQAACLISATRNGRIIPVASTASSRRNFQ
jgi:hypothetical protein